MVEARTLLGLLLVGLSSCGGAAPPASVPSARGAPGPAPVAPAPPAPDRVPRLELAVAPKQLPSPAVVVTLRASGAPPELVRWSLARAPASAVAGVRAEDASGVVPVVVSAEGEGLVLTLAREPVPPLTLSYERSPGEPGVSLDPNRLIAAGDALLALPAAWAERVVPVSARIEAQKLLPDARAASGFGVGERRTLEVSAAAVRRMTFLAGQMGHAVLDGPEGHDEVAWLGYTSFDPRSVAAEVASFRTAAREYFKEKRTAPFTLLLLSDGRPAGRFDAVRQTASVLLKVGVSQTYGGPLRIAVAHQLLREWMGPALWVGPDSAERRGESLWFVEGVTRFLARELSFRFGLLTPAEYLAEVDEIERLVVASPHAALGNAELGKRAGEAEVAALLVARGARHATSADARIREKSRGKRSLDAVLSELYAEAQRARGPLPESRWVAALERELGAGAAELHREEVGAGRAQALPNDALGPCFSAGPRRYESFALGFEVDGDLAELPVAVTRVAPGGAAARAGLSAGDRLTAIGYQPGSPAVPVRLELERAGAKRRLEYRPVGASFAGRGFTRSARVPDERCARR